MRKVAIFGAGGAVGHAVTPDLARRGVAVRVVGRNFSRLQREFGEMAGIEMHAADLSDEHAACEAARGADTIVYCVGLPYPEHRLLPALLRATLAGAERAGVERIVLVSSVYSYGVPRTQRVAETHPREPHTRKGVYRKEQEDALMAAHAAGRIAGLIVRLPDFYGPHADIGLANPIFHAALAGKTANWVGPVNTPHEFIFMPDAGPVIAELALRADCYGEAWNLGSAGSINTLDFITRIYRAAGREPKYRAAGRGLLRVLGWFNPTIREVVEMVYLQETPVILDDSKLTEKLGGIEKTRYDDGIRQTLEWCYS